MYEILLKNFENLRFILFSWSSNEGEISGKTNNTRKVIPVLIIISMIQRDLESVFNKIHCQGSQHRQS